MKFIALATVVTAPIAALAVASRHLARLAGSPWEAGSLRIWPGLAMAAAVSTVLGVAAVGRIAPINTTANAASTPGLSEASSSLLAAASWLNTSPLAVDDLRGKVILVNFWTYSCINSLRALPYVRAWADKYRDRGLVTIGVHTPEFVFEKNIGNVQPALHRCDRRDPVVTDNMYAIWDAFRNEAWPAFYLIGTDGRVRLRMLGEGDYDTSERTIQHLLSDAGGSPVTDNIAAIVGQGVEATADERDLRTPETYVGYAKASNFVSPGGLVKNAASPYRAAATQWVNQWGLAGAWNVGSEFATLTEPSGRIAFCFHARDLHLVMGPSEQGQPVRFRVKFDGAAPGASHGVDTDAEGTGSVSEPRLYQLIRQAGPVTDRTVEIEFLDPGVRAYVFTFG